MSEKLLIIDADTILYSSASIQQSTECLVTNIEQNRKKLFTSKTEFNKWAKENERDKSNYSFEPVYKLTGEPRFAFQTIKQKIENIVKVSGCSDYRVCIQGEGNFRKYYESEFVDYKGQRPAKPILFEECFEFMQRKYKDRCIVVENEETDDYVNIKAWEGYRKAVKSKNKEDSDVIIAYVDKDLTANGRGWYLNYYHLEEGIFWNEAQTQCKAFWSQILTGDVADNIPGLEKFSKETKEKYKIDKRGKDGVGVAGVEKVLADCVTEQDLAKRVIECYSSSWKDNWQKRLEDNSFFLYLRRKENEMFNIWEYLDRIGIKV